MKQKLTVFFLITLLSLLAFTARSDEKTVSKKLNSIFPKAAGFFLKTAALTSDKVESIQNALGVKLRPTDLNPTYYIALGAKRKPMGAVLFVDVESPKGTIIDGAVGLNMEGKVVKVAVYAHKETTGIADAKFLKQFEGFGVENKFQVGVDVKAVSGHKDASQAVALMPKKVLLMTYALFPKKSETKAAETVPKDEVPTPEIVEPESLIELMDMMKDAYDVIREYFQTGTDKASAVTAAKQLVKYTDFIIDFEPPKNPNETEEYDYFQGQAADGLRQFTDALEKEGKSDKTEKQWQAIVEVVNKAHLRFSVEEVDLDEDLK
jgi:Na+-translocating ferredoxin:NAD+ oxidoreductase RnfG subunit